MRLIHGARVVSLCVAFSCDQASGVQRPFTVADSIAMTRIADPNVSSSRWQTPSFKFSQNGRQFFVVTRRGNMQTALNEFSLLVFSVDEVLNFVDTHHGTVPKPAVLARFNTGSPLGGVTDAVWLSDGQSIAFIGRDESRIGQVYTINTQTREQRRLTNHTDDIAGFDLVLGSNVVVYSAWTVPNWAERNTRGYAVKSENVKNLVVKNPDEAIREVRYFVEDLKSGQTREVGMPPGNSPRGIWLSPTGRQAIVLAQVSDPPAKWWAEYESLRDYRKKGATRSGEIAADEDTFGAQSSWLTQFVLIDIATGNVRAILDAPSGSAMAGLVVDALWSSDGTRVVLANSYLPLNVSDEHVRQHRRRSPSIVEVELATGKLTPIVDVLQFPDKPRSWMTGVEGSVESEIVVTWPLESEGVVHKRYRKLGEMWVENRRAQAASPRIQLVVEQGINTPPDIMAISAKTRRKRAITDLNPELRALAMGTVKLFEWTTPDQRRWTGGLVLPPDYQEGWRYPVVIQTYGFNPNEFLVDGPDGKASAFAARALASKGILVLQIPRDLMGFAGPTENSNQLALVASAIDSLDASQLIDRQRVGIIGFSRTGMHVQHAITFTDPTHPIAAATICDSISDGYLSYVNYYGDEYPGMLWWERLIGAPFWEDDRAVWLERSAAFNLHRVQTPLRIEHLNAYVSPYWDTFAILKRHRRPVELIHIPDGFHAMQDAQPLARYASQQGNVDWFTFWLTGEEDPHPAKAAQYVRWRKLRQQRDEHLREIRSGVSTLQFD